MESSSFIIKNKLLNLFKINNNPILEMIFGLIIISVINYIFSFNFKDLVINLKKLFKLNNKKYKSSYKLEHKKNNLSETFKGILFFLETNKIKKINKYVESKELRWCRKTDDDIESLCYIPEEGNTYEIKKDVFIKIESREKKIEGGQTEIYQEYISILLFSYNLFAFELFEFINDCKLEYINHRDNTILHKQVLFNCKYNSRHKEIIVKKTNFNSSTNFDNLFFDQKDELLNCLNNFLNSKEWYRKIGIPYTLGLLLHGEPGCGKTSFIKALLNYLDDYKKKKNTWYICRFE